MDRLQLIGGAGRYLNGAAAVKISGLSKETIIQAIKDRKFAVNEKLILDRENIDSDRNWIQIETRSFLEWLEKRHQLELPEIREMLNQILAILWGMRADERKQAYAGR